MKEQPKALFELISFFYSDEPANIHDKHQVKIKAFKIDFIPAELEFRNTLKKDQAMVKQQLAKLTNDVLYPISENNGGLYNHEKYAKLTGINYKKIFDELKNSFKDTSIKVLLELEIGEGHPSITLCKKHNIASLTNDDKELINQKLTSLGYQSKFDYFKEKYYENFKSKPFFRRNMFSMYAQLSTEIVNDMNDVRKYADKKPDSRTHEILNQFSLK